MQTDEIDGLIERVVADDGLHASYAPVIRGYVLDRTDTWRICCATGCEPCMVEIGFVVDRVRRELGGARDTLQA